MQCTLDKQKVITGNIVTRRQLGRAHLPPTKLFRRLAVNKTILKPRIAGATGDQYVGFLDVIKFRVAAHTISDKALRFRQSGSGSKFMHAFLSNLANRQTDRQTDKRTRANAFTSSFVGGKQAKHRVAFEKTETYLVT